MHRGFVKLHRKMNDWEWKAKPNTVALFIHILLSANYKDTKYCGYNIKAGSLVAGIHSLSLKTGLTISQVRTALKNLKKTKEIAIKTTNKFSIITITNWDEYQVGDIQIANKSQTNRKQIATSKERKEVKKEKNNIDGLRPELVDEQIWNDFVMHRKNKKANITKTAMNRIILEAEKAEWLIQDVLSEMVNRGWIGFKAEWVSKQTEGNHKHGKQYGQSEAQRIALSVAREYDEQERTNIFDGGSELSCVQPIRKEIGSDS